MGKKLRTTVHVYNDEKGEHEVFTPGQELPAWAEAKVTNTSVFEGAPEVDGDPHELTKDQLLKIADEAGVETRESWSKDKIIDALRAEDVNVSKYAREVEEPES